MVYTVLCVEKKLGNCFDELPASFLQQRGRGYGIRVRDHTKLQGTIYMDQQLLVTKRKLLLVIFTVILLTIMSPTSDLRVRATAGVRVGILFHWLRRRKENTTSEVR